MTCSKEANRGRTEECGVDVILSMESGVVTPQPHNQSTVAVTLDDGLWSPFDGFNIGDDDDGAQVGSENKEGYET